MTKSAEDAIRARKSNEVLPPPKFESDYKEILETTIPAAISSLQKNGWPGGDISTVAVLNLENPSSPVMERVIWKLTSHMYLTSRGHIAIKVLDPLNELKYEYAEVDLEYLVQNHSHGATLKLLKSELAKLTQVDIR